MNQDRGQRVSPKLIPLSLLGLVIVELIIASPIPPVMGFGVFLVTSSVGVAWVFGFTSAIENKEEWLIRGLGFAGVVFGGLITFFSMFFGMAYDSGSPTTKWITSVFPILVFAEFVALAILLIGLIARPFLNGQRTAASDWLMLAGGSANFAAFSSLFALVSYDIG